VKPRVPQLNSLEYINVSEDRKTIQLLFTQSCTVFKNLQWLNFSSFYDNQPLTFDFMPSFTFSSNLLELHVAVDSIDDCYCLLDGHFDQLYKFFVMICTRFNGSASTKYKAVSCSLISISQ
jgi:hypothetical protein